MNNYNADDTTIVTSRDEGDTTPWIEILLGAQSADDLDHNTPGTISLSPSEARTFGTQIIAAADDVEGGAAAPTASSAAATWEFDTIVTRLPLSPDDGAQLHTALADRASQLEQLALRGWTLSDTASGTSDDVTTLIDSLQRFAPTAQPEGVPS